MSDDNSDYREIFGRDPEPWREPLGAMALTARGTPIDAERLRAELNELIIVLNRGQSA